MFNDSSKGKPSIIEAIAIGFICLCLILVLKIFVVLKEDRERFENQKIHISFQGEMPHIEGEGINLNDLSRFVTDVLRSQYQDAVLTRANINAKNEEGKIIFYWPYFSYCASEINSDDNDYFTTITIGTKMESSENNLCFYGDGCFPCGLESTENNSLSNFKDWEINNIEALNIALSEYEGDYDLITIIAENISYSDSSTRWEINICNGRLRCSIEINADTGDVISKNYYN